MKQLIENDLVALRRHMEQNRCAPSKQIITDNQLHRYSVLSNGIMRDARYTATLYPFENDTNGPSLVCSYGFLDERGGGYSYSSLMEK